MRTQHFQRFAVPSPGSEKVACFGKKFITSCVLGAGLTVLALLLAANFATHAAAQTEIAKNRPSAAPAAVAVAPPDGLIIATQATVTVSAATTIFSLSLTGPVQAQVFALANPYRVVVDMPDLQFDLADGVGSERLGLVAGFRFGLFGAGRSRMVIDTTGPVQIVRHSVMGPALDGRQDGRYMLQIELAATTPGAFADVMPAAAANAGPPILAGSPAVPAIPRPGVDKTTPGKLVIMIDPGHGGTDLSQAKHLLRSPLGRRPQAKSMS